MSTHGLRVVWRADAQGIARLKSIGRALKRFRPEVRPAVGALAARHPCLADLVVSFPALAVALARPRLGFLPGPVVATVNAGAPLIELAAVADVPMWLRRLPPEAFTGPLPPLPGNTDFARRIANHLPRSPRYAHHWLEAVGLAAYWAQEDFVVWIARECVRESTRIRSIDRRQLRRMALWAWFSQQPGTRGFELMDRPWNSAMKMKAARFWCGRWMDTLDLYLNLGDAPVDDVWLTPGFVDGFEFVPLRTANDVLHEARAMGNCLRTYGYDMAHHASRLWSMRKDGRRVATLRLTHGRREPLPNIYELELPRNAVASPDLWWVAHKWLHSHDLRLVKNASLPWRTAPVDRTVWLSLWRPWWLAKRRIPAQLPLCPTREVLNDL